MEVVKDVSREYRVELFEYTCEKWVWHINSYTYRNEQEKEIPYTTVFFVCMYVTITPT